MDLDREMTNKAIIAPVKVRPCKCKPQSFITRIHTVARASKSRLPTVRSGTCGCGTTISKESLSRELLSELRLPPEWNLGFTGVSRCDDLHLDNPGSGKILEMCSWGGCNEASFGVV